MPVNIKGNPKLFNQHVNNKRPVKQFRVFTQEVLEFSHNVSFLLLLPSCDSVCAAPGQGNPYNHHSSFLYLPLQMFEFVHFCCYRERFMSLYCHVSTLLELDSLISQQALREAISDEELLSAKQRHKMVSESVQQLDIIWREARWIMDVLQYARYKHPSSGLSITWFIGSLEEAPQGKNDSTSSHMDYLPSPVPSPENPRRNAVSDSQLCSDDEGCSEVFLPTDSDYDSSEAPSPRELDLLHDSAPEFRQQVCYGLSGSAPDVLQVHELRLKEECEQSSSFRGASESAPESSGSLAVGAMNKSIIGKASDPTNTHFLSKKGSSQSKAPRYQKHRHFNQNRWLCFYREKQSLSLSEGLYTHGQQTELTPETDVPTQITTFPQSPCTPGELSFAESTRVGIGNPKASVRRIIMDLCQKSSSQEESGSWSLSICGSQPLTTEVDSPSNAALETDCDELCDTQASDIFSSVL
ncbi:uncharacterized protein LOC121293690 [Carcharodon carcharias]|uniref:uncharacterized protein LOC121293690 n=1 Tax=Carcharodon carcharias TaxID=13397 RepID=UPI001B7F780E|nr:uncharacterized protein LOC121293690 [Carcharodon carcharias]